LGLTSGLIVSPCVTPALGAILVFITTKKNIFYGITLLMTFAYGMGLTLILVGTFSTIILHFPKSGKWLVHVERICAIILIGVGVYFIYNAIRRI
jgi:thiol:disulfide interchange protein DsbD